MEVGDGFMDASIGLVICDFPHPVLEKTYENIIFINFQYFPYIAFQWLHYFKLANFWQKETNW